MNQLGCKDFEERMENSFLKWGCRKEHIGFSFQNFDFKKKGV